MKKVVLRLLLIGLVFLALAVGVLAWGWNKGMTSKWRVPSDKLEKDAPRYLPAICEDMSVLREHPFFTRLPGTRDAADWLNPRIAWETTPDAGVHVPVEPVLPSDETCAHVKEMKNSLDDITAADCAAAGDFAWMSKLHEFDRWTLVGHGGPLSDAPHTAQWNSAVMPLPNGLAILTAVKLRLACALATKDPAIVQQAAKDVRQLAFLMHRTENAVVVVLSVAVLRIELRAWDAAKQRGIDVSGWEPVPADLIERFRRVMRVQNTLMNPAVTDDTVAAMAKCGGPLVARCVALTEIAGLDAALKNLIEEPYVSRAQRRLAQISEPDEVCIFELGRYNAKRPFTNAPDHMTMGATVGGLLMAMAARPEDLEDAYPDASIPVTLDGGTPPAP